MMFIGVSLWPRGKRGRTLMAADQVVDTEAEPAIVGVAKVNCRTCGAHWEDSSTDFWLKVRDNGFFPASCPACGDSLPEMTVESGDPEPAEQARLTS